MARIPWRAKVRLWSAVAAGAVAGILVGWLLVELLLLR